MNSFSNFDSVRYVWGRERIIVGVLREDANVPQALEEAFSHLNWVGTFQRFDVLGPAEVLGTDGKFVIEKEQPLEKIFENFAKRQAKSPQKAPQQAAGGQREL